MKVISKSSIAVNVIFKELAIKGHAHHHSDRHRPPVGCRPPGGELPGKPRNLTCGNWAWVVALISDQDSVSQGLSTLAPRKGNLLIYSRIIQAPKGYPKGPKDTIVRYSGFGIVVM